MLQRITQLEDRLFEDRQGLYRAQLMRQLNKEKAQLAASLKQSCPTDQHRHIALQCTAIESAQTVIDAIWNIYHARS